MPGGDGRGLRTKGGRGGRGRGAGGRGGGPSTCICPSCGFRQPHARGIPCVENKCPKCGMRMVRG